MKSGFKKLRRMDRGMAFSVTVVSVCSAAVAAFLMFYFFAYQGPHMRREVSELSGGWRYEMPSGEQEDIGDMVSGWNIPEGETLTLMRTMEEELPEAAVLIRANHQRLRVFLDGALLFAGPDLAPGENPGVAQRIVALPEGYSGKTLSIELCSPYRDYSGRVNSVLFGTVSSLEDYSYSESLRPLVMMALCLVVWVPMAVSGLLRSRGGEFHKERLAVGAFAVVWALFFVVSEYDVLPFFTPAGRSVFSLAMYFLIPVPFSFYFYFSFERYKKLMVPAVLFYCAFSAAALLLQLFGAVALPRIVMLNNIILCSTLYATVLSALEAKSGNRGMKLAMPFLIVADGIMLFYFYVFYQRRDSAAYHYRDVYFLLISAVLVYSIWHFFRDIYRQARENEMLSMQEQQLKESYESFKTHISDTARLKHDMQNHFTAMRAYLDHGRTEEARDYLTRYAGQSAAVTEAAYSEHFLLNAVVGSLYRQAEDYGIKVTANLSAVPLHIPDPDIYSLLANLTENAVEACAAMPEGLPRFISLTVTGREPYLSIRCENSKAGEVVSEDGKILTTKSGEGHGYGLGIIRRIVDVYDGIMNVEHDQNTFTVTLALKDR